MDNYRFTDGEIEEDERWSRRAEFLDARNLAEEDVMVDDLDREYVYNMDEDGTKKKVFLPE